MNRNMLMGVGMAAVMAVGLVAQTPDPTKQDPQTQPKPQTQTDDRKVTVQGCLERDYLYTPSSAATGTTATGTAQTMAPTPFKLTQVEIIKDEPANPSTQGAYGQASETTQAKSKEPKDIELNVAPAANAKNVDLDAQVNHKVELMGTMSSKDIQSAKAKTATDPQMKAPPLLFKATNVKSISDKCQ